MPSQKFFAALLYCTASALCAAQEEPLPAERYQVEIRVDGGQNAQAQNVFAQNTAEITAMLNQHLPLVNKKNAPNLDEDQIAVLVHETPERARQMINTLGYFGNEVSVHREGNTYIVAVKLGRQAVVDNVSILLEGAVEDDDALSDYYQDLLTDWRLPVGEGFNQSDWRQSKSKALAEVVKKKYPLAKITQSRALIHPQNATADLNLAIDSGQIVYFGEIEVSGSERYPARLASNMADFAPGDVYDLQKILDYQSYLEQDGHYSGAMIQTDFENLDESGRVPVRVTVTEVPRQKIEVGLKYDSSDGAGVRLGYDHYNLFSRAYTGSAVIDANRYEQNIGLGISQPRNRYGYFWTTGLGIGSKTLHNVESDTAVFGIWYARVRGGIDARLGVEYYLENSRIKDGPKLGNQYVTMATASWKRSNIETSERPANGYYFSGKIGTTVGSLLSSTSAQRILADAAYFYTPARRKWGTWIVRGGLGYVRTSNQENVPTALLFRTGGASTVRGYDQESIGLPGPNNSVLGGKAMAVAGLEYQLPFKRDYALAVFHDAGDVKNRFQDLSLKQSSGLGLRWFSPVAPLALDIAYAWDRKKIGWHINLGTRF